MPAGTKLGHDAYEFKIKGFHDISAQPLNKEGSPNSDHGRAFLVHFPQS